jgi:integrase/recombinase XerD
MEPRFEQFIHERKYLRNVSPRTTEWHGEALRWLGNPDPDEAALKDFVMRMREKGLRPVSCNSYISAVNSYLHWASDVGGVCCAACSHLKVVRMKDEQRILPTFTPADIEKIVKWKPRGFYQLRTHLFMLLLADTGCRSGEARALRWSDVDFDNLLLKLHGKGAKDRLVPFSFELRRHLYRWHQISKIDIVFPTRNGMLMGRRNVLRSVKCLCQRLGIAVPPRTVHSIRHFFASNYLRQGGNVFALQRVLGHSSLEMVKRYAALLTSDLQQIHEKISLLNPTKRGGPAC